MTYANRAQDYLLLILKGLGIPNQVDPVTGEVYLRNADMTLAVEEKEWGFNLTFRSESDFDPRLQEIDEKTILDKLDHIYGMEKKHRPQLISKSAQRNGKKFEVSSEYKTEGLELLV